MVIDMSKKILVIEDEDRMRKLIKDFLSKEDFIILEANNGENGLDIFIDNEDIDLVILDVMLPRVDGWSVLRQMKDHKKTPVIMLTARAQTNDELFGFELGVDDYITKPFNMKILLARIKVLLRKNDKKDKNIIEIGGLSIDNLSHKVSVDNKVVEFTPLEYDLLLYLIENKNIALSREKILNNVWGYDYYGDIRTVDTHIKRIRQKLKTHADLIKTVRGVGYTIEV
jgi:DNA-binding response OmpR family regulator